MMRRSFLKGLSTVGLLSILDSVGLLGEKDGQTRDFSDPATPSPQSAHPDQIPSSPESGDGVVMARLKQEILLIKRLGRVDEFRAARTVVSLARDEHIPCRLAGAGCSSIVTFLTGASDVLPTRHGLFFERFRDLNGRWAPPFVFYVEEANRSRLVDFAQRRYARLVADGTLFFPPMPSVTAIPWMVAGSLRKEGLPDFDLGQIPLDDQNAFELLRSGDTEGIMFFHCRASRKELQSLRPSSLADLAAISALLQLSVDHGHLMRLYGQRVKGSQCPEAVHPAMMEVTADSWGLILFQEQVMMLLNRLGGITVADGFDFIKAVAKRKSAIVAQYRARFLEAARENEIGQKASEAIFGQLQQAASFVCCKAGCVADAMVIYRGAYLKAHYPAEFTRAVQTHLARL
jgi:DNA polymerase III alpha subunit